MKKSTITMALAMVSGLAFMTCPLDEEPFIPPHVDLEGVEFNRDGETLYFHGTNSVSGNQAALTPIFIPANASNKAVTWESDDPDTVTVDENGIITAVALGDTVITVTADEGGFTAKCAVEVKPVVYYSDHGAVGDSTTDDFTAIFEAHAAANLSGAKVMADSGMTYYIKNVSAPAIIQTDTDWTDANFIIDDSAVTSTDQWIFRIESAQPSYSVRSRLSPQTLTKKQEKLNLTPPLETAALLIAYDYTKIRYIRRGQNQNSGATQQELFIVDKDGNVDMRAPIMWDYNTVSSLTAYPIDEKQLTVTGGSFKTIATQTSPPSGGLYYVNRGILVARSNTVVDGIRHDADDDYPQGAPYHGFVSIQYCANVTVKNSMFSGRKVFVHDNVQVGTYDIESARAVNLSVIDCGQTNNINDSTRWGVFASNYSKNILFDNVKFSRFDAHTGVYNATIRNSELGHQRVSIIGAGALLIENTIVHGNEFIIFRDDYGSSWEGELVIRNCTLIPSDNQLANNNVAMIWVDNDGQHNFGYDCYMPASITIDGFTVADTAAPANYDGVLLYRVLNGTGVRPYPITLTTIINLSRFTSSKPYRTFIESGDLIPIAN